jgi:hypothetical protein
MTTVRRMGGTSAALLSGLVLVFVAAQAVAPKWVRSAGLDVWNASHYHAAFRKSAEESARMEEESRNLRQASQLLSEITLRLATGRLTLDEATRECEALLRDRPGFVDTVAPLYYPAATLRLSIARFLISRVESLLEGDPSRLIAVSRSLEAAFDKMNRHR